MQVVENEGGYLSNVLYFNEDGQRAPFTAERLSDFRAQGGDATTPGWAATADAGLDVVLIIQVPLKRHTVPQDNWVYGGVAEEDAASAAPKSSSKGFAKDEDDTEVAVVGHGDAEGPFTEIDHLPIERDARFPIRVTVQFYKATSNGVVMDSDIAEIRNQIDRVYQNADWVGSLVTDGYTGRPTEWTKPAPQPPSEDANWAQPSWSWLKPW